MDIIDLNGRRWAVGLWWKALDDGQDSLRAASEHKQEYNLVALQQKGGAVRQIGLAQADANLVRRGIYALAPAVARLMGDGSSPKVRLLALEGGYWLYVHKNGAIAPDGDAFFSSREEAVKHYALLFPELEQLLPIEAQEVEKTESPEETLMLFRKSGILKPSGPVLVHTDKKKRLAKIQGKLFLALALVVAMFYGVDCWITYQAENDFEHQQEIAAAARAKKKDFKEPQAANSPLPVSVAVAFPSYWNDSPLPASVISRCGNIFSQLRPSIHGWNVDGYICTDLASRVTYARSQEALFSAAPIATKPTGNINVRVEESSLQALPKRAELAVLLSRDEAQSIIYDTAIRGHLRADLTNWKKPDPAVSIPEGTPPPIAPYIETEWVLSSIGTDIHGFDFLNDVPGIVVTSVVYEMKSGTWTIKGKIYALP